MNKKYYLVPVILLMLVSTSLATVSATYRYYAGDVLANRNHDATGFTFVISWTDTTATVTITRVAGSSGLVETQLYIGSVPPTSNAGSYPFKHENLGGATTDTYTVDITGLGLAPGGTLYFALHVVVNNPGQDTAWGLVTCDPSLPEYYFKQGFGWYYSVPF